MVFQWKHLSNERLLYFFAFSCRLQIKSAGFVSGQSTSLFKGIPVFPHILFPCLLCFLMMFVKAFFILYIYGAVVHCIQLNFSHLEKKVPLVQIQMYKMFYHDGKRTFCKIIHLTTTRVNSDQLLSKGFSVYNVLIAESNQKDLFTVLCCLQGMTYRSEGLQGHLKITQ